LSRPQQPAPATSSSSPWCWGPPLPLSSTWWWAPRTAPRRGWAPSERRAGATSEDAKFMAVFDGEDDDFLDEEGLDVEMADHGRNGKRDN